MDNTLGLGISDYNNFSGGASGGAAITFGVSEGETSTVGGAANEEHVYRTNITKNIEVQKLLVKFGSRSGSTGQFRLTLRENNAGSPGNLVAVTATTNESDYAAGEVAELSVISPTTVVPGDYWLGIHMGTQAVETASNPTDGLQRGKLSDSFADGTSTTPGSFTNFGGTIALLVSAKGVTV